MEHPAPASSEPPTSAPGGDARDAAAHRLREALLHLFTGDTSIAQAIENVATFLHVPAGAVLFREGDAGDAAFFVLTGRLRAVADTADGELVLSDAVRGETVGELALLTGQERSATVYAVRDSAVARVSAADFEALLRGRPDAALPITRILAGRLRRATRPVGAEGSLERTVAVLPIGTADAASFARMLCAAIDPWRPTHLIGADAGGTHATLDALLEDHGPKGRVVVCAGERGWTPWNDVALRHADEVILLADATETPGRGVTDDAVFEPRERGGPRVTLVLRHEPGRVPGNTERWLAPRPGIQHLHVRRDDPADLGRVARWVTGTSVGLVLGGGGARGWAHIGALRALEELGVPIDLVGGTSHGAAVAAAVADRRTADDMQVSARPWVRTFRDYTIPVVSVLRGRRIGRSLEVVVRPGISIEDLWLPYFAMATNLSRAERVVQVRGAVVEALRASISLPVVLPPVVRDGELLIDGGLLDNLPVGEMRRRVGTGSIIAIDPSPRSLPRPYDAFEPDVSGVRLLVERLVPFRRRRRVPSIGEMVQRTVMAGSRHMRERDRDLDPDALTLQPELGEWGLLAFEHLDDIVEAGYREMREPIAAWWADQAARRPS